MTNSQTFALACLSVVEFDRRVRVTRSLGGSMDLGGGWASFIEDAKEYADSLCDEIADVFEELFPDYEGYDADEWREICFELGTLWIFSITAAELTNPVDESAVMS